MTRKFTRILAALALLVFMMPSMAGWGQTRSEEVYKTSLFGSDYNSKGVSSYTGNEWYSTTDGFRLDIVNANNNNNGWNFIKIGGKNGAYTGTLTTNAAIDDPVTKVALTIDAITSSNVTSMKLYSRSNNSTSSWTEVGEFSKNNGTQNVTITAPTANLYYKIEVVCTQGSSNGLVTISKVEYYHNTGGAATPSISASNVEIAYDATGGSISYTINNPANDGVLTASTTATWLTIGNVGTTVPFTCSANENTTERTATVTLTYTYDTDQTVTKYVTVTQAQYVADYATLPFAFDGGRADIATTNGLTQEGLDSDYGSSPKLKFNGTDDYVLLKFNERPGTLTFDIKGNSFSGGTFTVQTSEDGVTYTDLETYTELGDTQHESFANLGENVRYIKWIYTEKSSGNVALGNIALAKYTVVPSITVADATVSVDAEEHDGTLALTYENLEVSSFEDFVIQFYDADENELNGDDEPDWIDVNPAQETTDEYVVSYFMLENEGTEARTAYFKVFALGDEDYVYSNLVTISQAAPVAPATGDEYALYTGELVEGDYLIVYDGGAMNTTVDSDRLQYVEVSATNNVIVTDNAEIVWHIAPSGQYWTIYNADANAYAASTGAKNKAQMLADGTDDKALWTVSGTETYEFVNKKNTANNVNANLRKNGTFGFACYATGTGGALSLYKKVEPTPAGIPLEIEPGQWYLIASPVGTVDPTEVDNMTTGEFALYNFNQNAAADQQGLTYEWENWKKEGDHYHFFLELGHGYLYAHSGDNTVALTFTGTPNQYDINNNVLPLIYNPDANLPGYNLLGNPFNETVYISGWPHYIMQNGSIIESQDGIAPMQGFFVIAEDDDQSVNLSNEPTEKGASVALNVSRNRGNVIDRARVCFDESRQLPKLQLFENSTKVYIPQNGKDYAVVRSEGQGELPVNFRASENGTYTLSIDAENMDMNYLHLIDNMTGMDIDLLQTPSYTFEANVNDYESRFRLVFAANNEDGVSTGSTTFAFYSNGNWIINNAGEATLQVVDLTGRILSSETVNGSVSTTLNAPTGVYMLRLINGDNVKVQKVVVR